MMMIAHPNAAEQKRDLHVGGVGSRTGGALAAISHPLDARDASNDLKWRARATLEGAADVVRQNPWAAIGVIALAGLAAGYLLGRR